MKPFSIYDREALTDRPYYAHNPKHVLLLPDGTRRYARREGISQAEAYALAARRCLDFLDVALNQYGLERCTIFFARPACFQSQQRTEENIAVFLSAIDRLARTLLEGKGPLGPDSVHVDALSLAGRPWMEAPKSVAAAPKMRRAWEVLKETLAQWRAKPKRAKRVTFLINYSGKAELDHALGGGRMRLTSPIGLLVRIGDGLRLSDCPLYALGQAHLALIQKYLPSATRADFVEALRPYYPEIKTSTIADQENLAAK
jgi:undecaprenyl pyrophosphate synthase